MVDWGVSTAMPWARDRLGHRWNLHAGPVVGWVRFDDATYADGSPHSDDGHAGVFRAEFDDTFAFGADAGIDFFLRECWGLTGGVQYLKVSAESDQFETDVDPLVVKLGLIYHF